MDDTLSLRRAIAGDAVTRCLQIPQDRGPLPSGTGVCGDAHGLVDDDNVLIVVQDSHVSHGRRLTLRLGDRHLDNVESAQSIRFPGSHAINQDISVPRQLRTARA